MATYLGTHGGKIQNYTTNPDNPPEGEVWYNETDNVLKFSYPNVTSAGSWRTQASINTSRQALAGCGIATAALAAGGDNPGSSPEYLGLVESWNGSAWTEANDLNTARRMLGLAGTYTSALAFGGGTPPPVTAVTETWNGTNWTEVNDLNTARDRDWET